MVDRTAANPAARKALLEKIDNQGVRATARELRIDRSTLARAASGLPVSARTIVALERFAPRVRTADEFARYVAVRPRAPQQGPYVWDLETIRRARDAQLSGVFDLPVRLAEAMRTDDALFNAYHSRIAAQSAVETRLVPASGARGEAAAKKAATSAFVSRSVLTGIDGTLANHGLAIGYVERDVNESGTRVNFRLTEWPLEFVRWRRTSATGGELVTSTADGQLAEIRHGDGQWIVFRKFHTAPWTQDACVLPGAFIWAAHGNGIADWAGASRSHGLAKIMGELQEGTALVNEDGTFSPEAAAFLRMLQDLVSGEGGAGIRPAGSKTEVLTNGSTAWQVFSELCVNREKAAARIYLGTDAILGSVGGAPGVDISALFGIATTKIQGDIAAIEDGLRSGFYEPWAALNFGTSQYAPALEYLLPDPDADIEAAANASKLDKFFGVLLQYRDASMAIDQPVVDALAKRLGVDDPPQLAAIAERAVQLTLAPTDAAKVTKVGEARASLGLVPFGDARDEMTITELDAYVAAKAAEAAAPPAAPVTP